MNKSHDILDIANWKIADIFPPETREKSIADTVAICASVILREFPEKLTVNETTALSSILSKWARVEAIRRTADAMITRDNAGEEVNITEGWPE